MPKSVEFDVSKLVFLEEFSEPQIWSFLVKGFTVWMTEDETILATIP